MMKTSTTMASFLLAIVSGLLYLQLSLASVAHATPVDLSTHRVYARPSPLLFTLKVSAPAGTAINGANISATNQTLYVIHPEGQGATCEGNQTHPNAATFYLWTNLHLLSTGDQVAYVMPSNSSGTSCIMLLLNIKLWLSIAVWRIGFQLMGWIC